MKPQLHSFHVLYSGSDQILANRSFLGCIQLIEHHFEHHSQHQSIEQFILDEKLEK